MAHFNDDILAQHEARIAALEAECATPEEKEINQFLVRVIRSLRGTLWIINGVVKWGAGPVGFIGAIWIFGSDALEWLKQFFTGVPK